MNKHFLITYGSLLSAYSRKHFSSIDEDVLPVEVEGWKRSWSVQHLQERATHAGATVSAGSSMTAALVPTEVTDELREREKYYEFIQVDAAHLSPLVPGQKLPSDAVFWICQPLLAGIPSVEFPLHQTYVDTCLIGCIESGLSDWPLRFLSETDGWQHCWINDRAEPRYPRAARLTQEHEERVDALLEQKGLLAFRREPNPDQDTAAPTQPPEQRAPSDPPTEEAKQKAEYLFAYGKLQERIGVPWRRARLSDHRLVFGKEPSPLFSAPISVVRKESFAVYGFLHRIDAETEKKLSDMGATPISVDAFCPFASLDSDTVLDAEPETHSAGTLWPLAGCRVDGCELLGANEAPGCKQPTREVSAYVLTLPPEAEELPDRADLEGLVGFLKGSQLPQKYVDSVQAILATDPAVEGARQLFMMSTSRRGSPALPLLQLPEELRSHYGESVKHLIVSFGERSCLATVQYLKPKDDEQTALRGDVCGVDENLRVRLGIPSREPRKELYTCCVRVSPSQGLEAPSQILQPRCLILSVKAIHHIHSEKGVCVLDSILLELLGAESGDYVQVHCYRFSEKEGRFVRKKTKLRAMGAKEKSLEHWKSDAPYPMAGCIHLDADFREDLGLGSKSRREFESSIDGFPVLVSVSVSDLILKRAIVYLFSFLGLTLAFALFLNRIWPETSVSDRLGLALLFSVFVTVTIIHLELRSRIRP